MPKWSYSYCGGGVIRKAVAGSRRSGTEDDLLWGDVKGRRGTEDAVVAGSGVTRKVIAGSQGTETDDNLLSVDERFRRLCKGTDDTVDVGCGVTRMMADGSGSRGVEMDGAFIICGVGGHPKDTEEEQRSLSQAKAPPQKGRTVMRVESADSQD